MTFPTEPYEEQYETASVRPYAVTGGRRAVSSSALPLEALVEALPAVQQGIGRGGQRETQEVYLVSDFQKTTLLGKGAGGR